VNSVAQRVMFVARRVDFSSENDVQGLGSDICSSVIDPIQEAEVDIANFFLSPLIANPLFYFGVR
jgi:hypothetical protein